MRTLMEKIIFVLILSLFFIVPQTSPAMALQFKIDENEAIIYAMPFKLNNYSNQTATHYSTQQWRSAIYSYLIKQRLSVDQSVQWINDLAKTIPKISTDDLTYTFELRNDLRFSNGERIRSDDIEFSFKVAITPEISLNSNDNYLGYLSNESIKILDARTIEITFLKIHPSPYTLLDFPIIHNETFSNRYNSCLEGLVEFCNWNQPDSSDVISSGPFKLFEVNKTVDSITLTMNPFYYDSENVFADIIEFQYFPNRTLAVSGLNRGVVHIVDRHFGNDNRWVFAEGLTGIDNELLNFNRQEWSKVKMPDFEPNIIHPPCGDVEGQCGNDESNERNITFSLFPLLGLIPLIIGRRINPNL